MISPLERRVRCAGRALVWCVEIVENCPDKRDRTKYGKEVS